MWSPNFSQCRKMFLKTSKLGKLSRSLGDSVRIPRVLQPDWVLRGLKVEPSTPVFENKSMTLISTGFRVWSQYVPVWNAFLPDQNPSGQVWNESIPDWNRILPDQTIISGQIYHISSLEADRKKRTSHSNSNFNTWILGTIFIPKFWYVSGRNQFRSGRYPFQSGRNTFQPKWIPSTVGIF